MPLAIIRLSLARHVEDRNVWFPLCLHEGEYRRDRKDNRMVLLEDLSRSGCQGQSPGIPCPDKNPFGFLFCQDIQFVLRQGGMTVFPLQAFRRFLLPL